MATYIDLSAAVNGSGTEASPYNTLDELNALNGDQSGAQWLIKRGTEIRGKIEFLTADNISNLFIGAYGYLAGLADPTGVGSEPTINGSDIHADWTSVGSNQYTISSAAIHRVWVNDVSMEEVATQGALTNNTMWFDSGNSLIYIQTAVNPNTASTEVTARKSCYIQTCSGITLSNLHFTKSDDAGCKLTVMGNDCRVLYCRSTKNGGWNASSNTGFSIIGASFTSLSTGFVMRGCVIEDCQNNIIETQFLDGALIEDIDAARCGMGLEIWGSTQNSTFRRFRIRNIRQVGATGTLGHQNFIWLTKHATTSGVTGSHYNNTFSYFDCVGCSGAGVHIDSGVLNKFYNNTFITDENASSAPNTRVFDGVTGTATVSIGNPTVNIELTAHTLATNDYIYLHTPVTTDLSAGWYQVTKVDANNFTIPAVATAGGTISATTCHANDFTNNIFVINYAGSNQIVFRENTTCASTADQNWIYKVGAASNDALVQWGAGGTQYTTNGKAAWQAIGGGDFADPDLDDLTSSATPNQIARGDATDSPVLNQGTDLSLPMDVNKDPIYGLPDVGAIHRSRIPPVTIGVSLQ